MLVDEADASDPRVTGICRPGKPATGGHARRAVMGVYAARCETLIEALEHHVAHGHSGLDFDLDVLASLVGSRRVGAYRFGGTAGRVSQDRYWNDLSDLDAYFRANMSLLEPVPPLDLYQDGWRIWSRAERNPPARTVESASGNEGLFVNSIVSNGTVVRGATVSRSVLFPRVRVEDGASVERSVLFHGARVGEGAALRNCIVEKGVRIAPGERIGFDALTDRARHHISREGIVVVTAAAGRSLERSVIAASG